MSFPAVTQASRLFPPYDSAPFQVLSALSIQAAGTERGYGGWHGPFPGPGSGSHTPLPGFSHVDPPYCKGGWEMSPSTRGKRDRVAWGSRTHTGQAPCIKQSKDSFPPWSGLGWRSLGQAERETCLAGPHQHPAVSILLSTQDLLPREASPQSRHSPGIHLRGKGTNQTNPAFLCPQCLPSTKWEEK